MYFRVKLTVEESKFFIHFSALYLKKNFSKFSFSGTKKQQRKEKQEKIMMKSFENE